MEEKEKVLSVDGPAYALGALPSEVEQQQDDFCEKTFAGCKTSSLRLRRAR
jgi:hypothetical protein